MTIRIDLAGLHCAPLAHAIRRQQAGQRMVVVGITDSLSDFFAQ